jgi:hypothetical protein
MAIRRNGVRASPGCLDRLNEDAADERSMVKTYFAERSLELKQLSLVTSATSEGSANVISTHWKMGHQ